MANIFEFAILVKNNGATKPIAQLDLHNGQSEVFGIGMHDGLH